MLSKRSILSLTQYLDLPQKSSIDVLLQKHGFPEGSSNYIPHVLSEAPPGQIDSLLEEIVRTQADLKELSLVRYEEVSSGQRYDERWDDLVKCLLLNNYRIETKRLVAIEPTIEGAIQVEDDLSRELNRSNLPEAEEIIRMLNNSAEAFRRTTPDYNGCLTNARVALQTLATSIARRRQATHPGPFDETKWGEVLAYLRKFDFINCQEEQGISGVFTFASPGAHSPVGLNDSEIARLGHSLVVSMCYFLVKRYNG